jgi:hypothetical protein
MHNKKESDLCYQAGLGIFKEIKKLYLNLEMQLDEENPNVDIMMIIPKQKGLDFEICLNLQNIDELHLEVGKLWMCWFPCTERENKNDYLNTLNGLITGKYRILETIKGNKVVKAQLQLPMNGEWISKSSGLMTFSFPSFRRRSFNIIQNTNNA